MNWNFYNILTNGYEFENSYETCNNKHYFASFVQCLAVNAESISSKCDTLMTKYIFLSINLNATIRHRHTIRESTHSVSFNLSSLASVENFQRTEVFFMLILFYGNAFKSMDVTTKNLESIPVVLLYVVVKHIWFFVTQVNFYQFNRFWELNDYFNLTQRTF